MNNQLISSHPDIMMGKPVIDGTRITVESILEKMADLRGAAELLCAQEFQHIGRHSRVGRPRIHRGAD